MKRLSKIFLILMLISSIFSSSLHADEKEDLLVIRNTVINLLQQLVDQGVMTPEQAASLVTTAQQTAASEAAALQQNEEIAEDTVRIQYVPEIVKEEIRAQVRAELKADVTEEVIRHAEDNRWGIKDALPEWLNKISISGDLRLRADGEYFDENNSTSYIDVLETNETSGTSNIVSRDIQTDRQRGRTRLRLLVKADVNDNIEAGVRIVTGAGDDPLSANQDLGTSKTKFDINLDQAFLTYKNHDQNGFERFTATGGRIANPWVHTSLVWDSDVTFDGLALTGRYNFAGNQNFSDLLPGTDKEVFITLGGFPLDENSLSTNDPWLFGGQVGGSLRFRNKNSFQVAASYYRYDDLQGDIGEVGDANTSTNLDFRLPGFTQSGNTLFDVSAPPGFFGDLDGVRFGYAADYHLLGLTTSLDLFTFAPYRLRLAADFVENIGYDSSEVQERLRAVSGIDDYDRETTGYQIRTDFGWPSISGFGQWNVFLAYQYLERDAVLDAFTDSNFHGGGTDAEGYILGAEYGLAKNTSFRFRWISTNEISGPEFLPGVDCDIDNCDFQNDRALIDINTRF